MLKKVSFLTLVLLDRKYSITHHFTEATVQDVIKMSKSGKKKIQIQMQDLMKAAFSAENN